MIEDQFEAIATEYSRVENDENLSQYELTINWPSIVAVLPKAPAVILDYGCGSGLYARKLRKDGYEVYAADNAPSMVRQLHDFDDRAFMWTYQDEPLSIKFDVIIAKLVVQFVEDLQSFAAAMRHQLVKNGLLIISVPHPDKSRPQISRKEQTYLTRIGVSDLSVTMIHRELEEYKYVFAEHGFVLNQVIEPTDPANPLAEFKRLNLVLEAQ